MNGNRTFLLLSALTLSAATSPLVGGCASDDAAQVPDRVVSASDTSTGPVRIANDSFDPACCTKLEFDLNRDNKTDAYVFVKVVDGSQVVLRKENDVNYDGKIDLVRTLNDRGELVEERLDTDFDGRIDVVVFLEKGNITKKEYDTNFDFKVDMWRFFDKGAMAREEADLNYDGRVDYWEYFEGGRLDRVGIDRDADGNVDEWIQSQTQES